MAHPTQHAKSSVRRWGGTVEQYEPIHAWFDQTKAHIADHRHRMVLHNSFGIFLAEQVFGQSITVQLEDGRTREVYVRYIGEQHVKEDFGGRIPTLEECLRELPIRAWMGRGALPLTEINEEGKPLPDLGIAADPSIAPQEEPAHA